jgi:hypothetical protein
MKQAAKISEFHHESTKGENATKNLEIHNLCSVSVAQASRPCFDV